MKVAMVTSAFGLALIAALHAQDPPTITDISGSLTHGGTITLTGAGFGEAPSIVKADDFEGGATGRVVANGWDTHVVGGAMTPPVYSDRIVRPNATRSAQARFHGGTWTSSFGTSISGLQRVYLDAWYYYDATDPPSRNHKVFRFHARQDGEPNLAHTMFCGGSTIIAQDGLSGNTSDSHEWTGGVRASDYMHRWAHLQVYVEQSSPGRADGTFLMSVNGEQVAERRGDFLTRNSGDPLWSTLWLGNYMGHGSDSSCEASGDASSFWDRVYISDSQARVEIGDAQDYHRALRREIQIPQSWNGTSITVRVHQGSFDDLRGLYLFVTSRSGRTSRGVPLSRAGESPAPTAPAAPTGLRIVG